MVAHDYLKIKQIVAVTHSDEIKWARQVKPCNDPYVFFQEYVWVVVNSGMRNQIAEKIYTRILEAIGDRKPIKSVFGHPGKAWAIEHMMENYESRFNEYRKAGDKLAYLERLPWIGRITKYHLARNLGMDVCKPDRHLQRIAVSHCMTPHALCTHLSALSGDRIGVVDVVLWRAANLRLI